MRRKKVIESIVRQEMIDSYTEAEKARKELWAGQNQLDINTMGKSGVDDYNGRLNTAIKLEDEIWHGLTFEEKKVFIPHLTK